MKCQPKRFDDLVGQEPVVTYLKSLIRLDSPRSVLLHGPSGSGKTSACRIYMRALHCEAPEPEGSPCYACNQCNDLATGGQPNCIEVSGGIAGTVEGIAQARTFADEVSLWGPRRTVFIDDCDELQPRAWDVLLRVLEEAPDGFVMILATRSMTKVPRTVVSRCQVLQSYPLDDVTAVFFLESAARRRSLEASHAGMQLLARLSRGDMNRLLANLDKVARLGAITNDNARIALRLDPLILLSMTLSSLERGRVLTTGLPDGTGDLEIRSELREFLLFLLYSLTGEYDALLSSLFKPTLDTDVDGLLQKVVAKSVANELQPEGLLQAYIGMLDPTNRPLLQDAANPELATSLQNSLCDFLPRLGQFHAFIGRYPFAPVNRARQAQTSIET